MIWQLKAKLCLINSKNQPVKLGLHLSFNGDEEAWGQSRFHLLESLLALMMTLTIAHTQLSPTQTSTSLKSGDSPLEDTRNALL